MSLNKKIMVDMPNKRITTKIDKKGTIYVYYTVRAYRRESDGKPTSEQVIIGRKHLETGLLIPNERYYELFDTEGSLYTPQSIKTYGSFFLLNHIANQLGLTEKLSLAFHDKWKQIMTVAMYMVCRGNVVSYCNYWCEETYNLLTHPLMSPRISELFESISFDERMNFFKQWSNNRLEKEYRIYDVTSISSYATKINNIEYGYNRDGEDLPQINLGMFTGEKTRLPIYYNTYAGSITDKEQLQYMMKYAFACMQFHT